MSVTAPIPTRPLRPTYASRGAYRKQGRMEVGAERRIRGRGWRLPAPEIERSVAAAACKTLSHQDRRYRQPRYPFQCGFASG
jgi:hypothetical protein